MAFKYEISRCGKGWAVTIGGDRRILETQPSEEAAEIARREYAMGKRRAPQRPEVWLIEDHFIAEPEIGGMQIGETTEMDIRHFEVVRRLSQDEFDAEMEAYREEYGHYPDA